MSLWIGIGLLISCWAMLSIIGGERFRQQQEIEATREARRKALAEAEIEAS